MTSDDRFDELLQEAAPEHNSPPETPRAEMWAAIAAARRAAPGAPMAGAPNGDTRVNAPDMPVRVIPLRTRHRRTFAVVLGLAATLMLGVLIGRESRTPNPAPAPATVAAAAATGAAAQLPAADNGNDGVGPVIKSPIPPSNAGHVAATAVALAPNGAAAQRTRAAALPASRPAAAADAARPYRVAAIQHLVTTEALLVSLRSDVRAGRQDTTIAVWAGDLLGTTRMLIDSPAGRDPQLKRLLEDLELVLAQIARLPGAHGQAADLGLIEDAVRHRQIMTRLRALSPDT